MTLTEAIQATAQELLARPRGKAKRAPITLDACVNYVSRVADGLNISQPLCPRERQTRATLMRYVNGA